MKVDELFDVDKYKGIDVDVVELQLNGRKLARGLILSITLKDKKTSLLLMMNIPV